MELEKNAVKWWAGNITRLGSGNFILGFFFTTSRGFFCELSSAIPEVPKLFWVQYNYLEWTNKTSTKTFSYLWIIKKKIIFNCNNVVKKYTRKSFLLNIV